MQTFSDFINRRFGYNENTDQNQQVVPEETIKKSMELEKIIHLILDNPNYFKKFFETVKELNNQLDDCMVHTPGATVGGHCIPVYPYLYEHFEESNLIKSARKYNENQPRKILPRDYRAD